MAEVTAPFEGTAQPFFDYGLTARGYVRYAIAQQNLAGYLHDAPLTVLDVGGGSGIDSVWLAEQGHEVTLAEPAEAQRELAAQRARDAHVEIEIVPDTTDQLLADRAGSFDLVLSHGVAMYTPKPSEFVADVVQLVRPNGLFSLLEKNYYGREAHHVLKQDWSELRKLQTTHKSVNEVGELTWAFTSGEIDGMLKQAGARILQWTGVRMVSDWMEMPAAELSPEDMQSLLEVEFRHGRDKRMRAQGQMLHYITRRTG